MERKLRISHKSFENSAKRFLNKFVPVHVGHNQNFIDSDWQGLEKIMALLVKRYKHSPFRKMSAYIYKMPETGDMYKLSYIFEKTETGPKLSFKLHIRMAGWPRYFRYVIMTIRLKEEK